ncbi:transmembrane protein 208 [Pseudomyrmex gracilis]|uniref:transmembrane protein 208 n=1 Tax=Pseudomyrmex gracilis TaxID=219809 RepID=UPI00099570DF|nr:transmembrane protein 208 [Pseudomyrmex gracilis]
MTVKKGKVLTKGAKQIMEDNTSTLKFYAIMAISAMVAHVGVTFVMFEFTTLTIVLVVFSLIVYAASYQFMSYMANPKYSSSGQLLDSGVDLDMEGGIGEHVKDVIILTSGVQVLSLFSNYFWLFWLLVPLRGGWLFWKQILGPWFFAQPSEQPEISEKKQRKMEKKMARKETKRF